MHVGFVVEKVAEEHVFSLTVLVFCLSAFLYQCSILGFYLSATNTIILEIHSIVKYKISVPVSFLNWENVSKNVAFNVLLFLPTCVCSK
jgi:hypothetical protein